MDIEGHRRIQSSGRRRRRRRHREAIAETLAKENVPLENLDEFAIPTYSAQEQLNRKDFSEMGVEESRAIARAILLIATKIATQISRRKKVSRRGALVDLRWTMRKNMKYGGEIIDLVQRKRRIKKTKVVLLCDVSGSMDCYSRFLIQFMYGLQTSCGASRLSSSAPRSAAYHISFAPRISPMPGKNLGQNPRLVRRHQHRRFAAYLQRSFARVMVTHRTGDRVISDGWGPRRR